jgi:hypothetical protein
LEVWRNARIIAGLAEQHDPLSLGPLSLGLAALICLMTSAVAVFMADRAHPYVCTQRLVLHLGLGGDSSQSKDKR